MLYVFIVRAIKVLLRFASHRYFQKRKEKTEKKEKRKPWIRRAGLFCQGFLEKYYPTIGGVEIFWGWRSAPLSALPTIPVTLLLCFGVFESEIFIVFELTSTADFICGSEKQVIQPWAFRLDIGCNEWSDSETGCGQWTSIASRLRVEPPVADRETRRMRAVDGYCLQQGAGVCFCSLNGYR